MKPALAEYRTIAEGAGWMDRSARGRIRVTGRDASLFLHALVSNDVASLQPGQGCYATYLTPQGRMIADPAIYRREDDILIDVAPGVAAGLAARLDMLIFSEDAQVADVSSELEQVAVCGGDAVGRLSRALGLEEEVLAALPMRGHLAAGAGADAAVGADVAASVTVARIDDTNYPTFDVFMPAGDRAAILNRLEAEGIHGPLDAALVTLLRIEAGRPLFGVDMTTETIPLEAGLLERAISQTKGCYVGQEIIVRVLHRGGGRVAKRLVQLDLDPPVPDPGAPILEDGREVGRVTSAAWSPAAGRVVALGYVSTKPGHG